MLQFLDTKPSDEFPSLIPDIRVCSGLVAPQLSVPAISSSKGRDRHQCPKPPSARLFDGVSSKDYVSVGREQEASRLL